MQKVIHIFQQAAVAAWPCAISAAGTQSPATSDNREHLSKSADEFSFRWNTRADTDWERTAKAVGKTGGKRLTYRQTMRMPRKFPIQD